MEYTLSPSFAERYREFLTSDNYRRHHEKSEYWDVHAKKVNVSLAGNTVSVSGDSGFYIPTKSFISDIRAFFRRSALLSYVQAFDKVADSQWVFPSTKSIRQDTGMATSHVIRAYYYYNILQARTRYQSVLEIGGGNGNLLSLLCRQAKVIDVDLPETLSHAMVYISSLFPDKKILMPHESGNFEDYDIVFLTPDRTHEIEDNSIDLAVNIHSFQEMRKEQISDYFSLIQRVCKKGGYFFTSNRVEKIPSCSGETTEEPIRFSEYPWGGNEVLLYEICQLMRLVQLDNVFNRLERIVK